MTLTNKGLEMAAHAYKVACISRMAMETDPDGTPTVAVLNASIREGVRAAFLAVEDAGADSGWVTKDGMASVTREDANNYCRILTILGMEEEGDPVAEVERLAALTSQGQGQGDGKHPNDWRGNIPVRGYESDAGGLFHDHDAAERSGKFGIVWELVRSLDIPASPAGVPDDGARFRFVVEHNWIGAKTRCERCIQDSDLESARRAVDDAIDTAPSAPEGGE